MTTILIVDDEPAARYGLRRALESKYRVAEADSAETAREALTREQPDLVLLDVVLPGQNGIEFLRWMREQGSEIPVLMVSALDTAKTAVEALQLGAADYLVKGFELEELRQRVANLLKLASLERENDSLRRRLTSEGQFGAMIGRTAEMRRAFEMAERVGATDSTVLILGESGTGKEMVARSIHYSGPFRDKPFIPVDCGSLVPTLIESELFGYVKGAFTGANGSKDGLMAMAEGGTIFLDEVGELPVDLQAKMLRAIQEKEIRPVGSTRRVAINIRILAATNRDLEQAVTQGNFRRDLYFRLNVLSLRIPALRERRQDIPLLIGHFLERMARTSGQEKMLSDEALKAMLGYDWPGNVRELENCLERTYAFTSGPLIHITDLPREIANLPGQDSSIVSDLQPKIIPMAELEKRTILSAITELNGDKLQAARLLGIGKTTLYRKLKDYATEGYQS